MLQAVLGVLIRIISNSYLNVLQKLLTTKGSRSSDVNFYTYLGISILGTLALVFSPQNINTSILFDSTLIYNFIFMGLLGALGNYFIIKALSMGELSSLAPINSYKPVIAMLLAFFYLKEIPSLTAFVGILLIIAGTYFIFGSQKYLNKKAVIYRVLALIASGCEAIFIKKIILLTNIPMSFVLWAFSGLIFSYLFVTIRKEIPKIPSKRELLLLILSVFIMQYSTNFVFSKINVSYALALFQLSTILSVFLGVNIFKEKRFKQKIIASLLMLAGAVIIILT